MTVIRVLEGVRVQQGEKQRMNKSGSTKAVDLKSTLSSIKVGNLISALNFIVVITVFYIPRSLFDRWERNDLHFSSGIQPISKKSTRCIDVSGFVCSGHI